MQNAGIINNYYPGDNWREVTAPPGPPPELVSAVNTGSHVQIEIRGFRIPPESEAGMEMAKGTDIRQMKRSFRVLESGLKDITPNSPPHPYIKVKLYDDSVKIYMKEADVVTIQALQREIPPHRVVES
jgi:hypothetical protein